MAESGDIAPGKGCTETLEAEAPCSAEGDEERRRVLGRLLELVDPPEPIAAEHDWPPGLHAVRVVGRVAQAVVVESSDGRLRGRAELAPFVDGRLLDGEEQRVALVEARALRLTLVGFLQTTVTTSLRGQNVEIDAEHELVLRSGRAALRLRADGTVELIGTRISAVSRGVLRLLGRALRLN